MRVLSVDDFGPMRRIIRTVVQGMGPAEVIEAENGQRALEKLRTEAYDLVISDWNMPGMDGLELLSWVRSDPQLKELPFLMVTVRASKEDVLSAISAGVSSYLVKPFTPEALKEQIRKILG